MRLRGRCAFDGNRLLCKEINVLFRTKKKRGRREW